MTWMLDVLDVRLFAISGVPLGFQEAKSAQRDEGVHGKWMVENWFLLSRIG